MRACPQLVIAVVHGPACGGGFAFALAADVRIVGESARMDDAFVNLGVSGCELGVSFFLPRHVGLSVAAELMYTGRFITAHAPSPSDSPPRSGPTAVPSRWVTRWARQGRGS